MVLDDLWGIGHPDLARKATAGLRQRLGSKLTAQILRDAIARSPAARGLAWETMALAFEAWRAIRRGDPGVDEKLARIDELVRQGPNGHAAPEDFLRLARILEEHGQPARALEMLDRRPFFLTGSFVNIPEGWEWAGRLGQSPGRRQGSSCI
jgi:hypothetical protein